MTTTQQTYQGITVENLILQGLFEDEEYTRKVAAFLKPQYFFSEPDRVVFVKVVEYFNTYNNLPTPDIVKIEIEKDSKLSAETITEAVDKIYNFAAKNIKYDWLTKETERFCQERAVYLALMDSIAIMDGKNKKTPAAAIPSILQEALGITFDVNLGIEYFDKIEERFDPALPGVKRYPFLIDKFNQVTNGGVTGKTLNVIMGPIGGGKTLTLCDLATNYVKQGYNVLYFSHEMSKELITQRIDANMMDFVLDDIINKRVPMEQVKKVAGALRANTKKGRLLIKDYPANSASAATYKAFLQECKVKGNFVPDIIIVDYLNLVTSYRIKDEGNLYLKVMYVAEELRSLAFELDIPIWSATQLNREGLKTSDPDMSETAQSIGLPATCDLFWVYVTSDQLAQLNQMMVKQLKNRFRDHLTDRRFVIGFDKKHMRIYDTNASAQADIVDEEVVKKSVPIFGQKKNNNPGRFKGITV